MRQYTVFIINNWIHRGILASAALLLVLFTAQCAFDQDEGSPRVGITLQELLLDDARICSDLSGHYPQELIDGLSIQLIDEMRCMDPGWLEYYTPCKDVGCIWDNGPQPLAARPEVLDALRTAATSKNDFITINAAYRDVGMQYFSRWRTENCDSNFMAAIPGRSNHQGGRAIDVQSHGYWADTLIAHGFNRPYYPRDRPHFELVGDAQYRAESEQLKQLSILAFQVLWNKNNPHDLIDEDGLYGPATKSRLGNSPVEGFPIYGCEPEPDLCDDFPCEAGCDALLCQQYCDDAPCADGCDEGACQQYCDADPCADGCSLDNCEDHCTLTPCADGCDEAACQQHCDLIPCADGCDAQTCDDYCENDPCADGCDEAACVQFCEEMPCADGCPIEGCSVHCEDDPCNQGCDPTQCEGFCEDLPCADGCSPTACANFCIRNPCDPSCGEDACTSFCEITPCASVCEGSEECVKPDQDLCRDDSCEEFKEAEDVEETVDPVEPEDSAEEDTKPPADVNNLTNERGGCTTAPAPAPPWEWLLALGALWVFPRRRVERPRRSATKRM